MLLYQAVTPAWIRSYGVEKMENEKKGGCRSQSGQQLVSLREQQRGMQVAEPKILASSGQGKKSLPGYVCSGVSASPGISEF